MTEKKVDSPFWSIVGKVGVLIALTWGAIQIYIFFTKTADFQATVNGQHFYYETPPSLIDEYTKTAEYKALLQTLMLSATSVKNINPDSILKNLKSIDTGNFKLHFNRYLERSMEKLDTTNYSALWFFTVTNTGNRSLEDLVLEVPFDGYSRFVLPNNIQKESKFVRKIEIGDLRPSYQVTVYCWTDKYIELADEKKTRFTHKNGWFDISYPVRVTGFYSSNYKLNNWPVAILFSVIVILLIAAYFFGRLSGRKTKVQIAEAENVSGNADATK